jgi:hypothetical protein
VTTVPRFGYLGNDMEIISEIQKHPNARVFAYGIGSRVNHFLLDKMAEAGNRQLGDEDELLITSEVRHCSM